MVSFLFCKDPSGYNMEDRLETGKRKGKESRGAAVVVLEERMSAPQQTTTCPKGSSIVFRS